MKTKKSVLLSVILLAFSTIGVNAGYIGLGLGYLTDEHEAFTTIKVGFSTPATANIMQDFEIEIGITNIKDSVPSVLGTVRGELEIVPIMANYKLNFEINKELDFMVGVGAGASMLDVDLKGGVRGSDDDTVFTSQFMFGVAYHLREDIDISIGYRHLWIDDSSFFGVDIDDVDEGSIEIGMKYKF